MDTYIGCLRWELVNTTPQLKRLVIDRYQRINPEGKSVPPADALALFHVNEAGELKITDLTKKE